MEVLPDRLSALPDHLLLQTLSFLTVKEAITTCVLSKRWKPLWTDLSKLEFHLSSYDIDKTRQFVAWVERIIPLIFSGNQLEKFSVDFSNQECFASEINRWVGFILKNKVKEVGLHFQSPTDLYPLPQKAYFNPSLTNLSVKNCLLRPQLGTAVSWGRLTSLSMDHLELDEVMLGTILSGCPVLKILNITACWGLDCLWVDSPSLYELTVEDLHNDEKLIKISAPYLRVLKILDNWEERVFDLIDVSSLVEASVKLVRTYSTFCNPSVEVYQDTMSKLIESLENVKELELGPWCIEVISVLETEEGWPWQLPQLRQERLTVNTWNVMRSFPGILGLLKSSPYVETLVINKFFVSKRCLGTTYFESFSYLKNCNLDPMFYPSLKTVKINGFLGSEIDDEPMTTLVQILLKRASALEKMIIEVQGVDFPDKSTQVAQNLLSFPRSSPDALILLRYSAKQPK